MLPCHLAKVKGHLQPSFFRFKLETLKTTVTLPTNPLPIFVLNLADLYLFVSLIKWHNKRKAAWAELGNLLFLSSQSYLDTRGNQFRLENKCVTVKYQKCKNRNGYQLFCEPTWKRQRGMLWRTKPCWYHWSADRYIFVQRRR